MDILFTVRHNTIGIVMRLTFLVLFLGFAAFFIYQMTAGPFGLFPTGILAPFMISGAFFLLIGLYMLYRTIKMILNPVIITARRHSIEYKKDSYDVHKIARFIYNTYYESDRHGRRLVEELVIEGHDGAMTMNISATNMSTREMLDLFRQHYPEIPVITV